MSDAAKCRMCSREIPGPIDFYGDTCNTCFMTLGAGPPEYALSYVWDGDPLMEEHVCICFGSVSRKCPEHGDKS